MSRRRAVQAEVHDGIESRTLVVRGRDAWALQELVTAGTAGVSPINHPGPRWSGYIHKLRRKGIDIETIDEAHGGPFAGTHARYVLRSQVRITSADSAEAA